jgi:hypothetical protein
MYRIEIQSRQTGNWNRVVTREPIETIEAARAEYAKYSTPSTDWGYARIASNGEIIETNEHINFWKR